ncbi:hypothetical protein [Thioclava sp. GXIMD4215]|uniref:hypothetical protein n=1 Tax=Thioclava sp. GXIMD4215 TaxID=3131928 RepID=UPI00311AF335
MTHSILTGSELLQCLKDKCSTDAPASLAVAFWGSGALKELGAKLDKQSRLVCNLKTGGTNPYEIRKIIDAGYVIRQHNTLHGKIGIVGNSFSFAGSSNLSANGLGFEGQEQSFWEEVNVAFDHVDEALQQRFEDLWGASSEISDLDLAEAETRWRPNRTEVVMNGGIPQQAEISLWQAIKNNDERLRSIPCVIAYYYEMEEAEREEFDAALGEITIQHGAGYDAFSDWDELPEGFIISVCRSRAQGHRLKDIEYCCRRPGASIYEKGDTNYLVVETLQTVPGFVPMSGGDLNAFKEVLVNFIGSHTIEESRIIPLNDLIDAVSGQDYDD